MLNKIWLISLYSIVFPSFIVAQPDFSKLVESNGVRCFRDISKSNVAYYAPGKIQLAIEDGRQPDFNFIQTRYTGNVAYHEKGSSRFWSLVRFKVILEHHTKEQLDAAKKVLWTKGQGTLRAVPLVDIQSSLIFTSIGKTSQDEISLGSGTITDGGEKAPKKGSFWKEREFTLKLSNESSQALASALQSGQTLLSLQYAFFSRGVSNADSAQLITQGESEILESIKKHMTEKEDSIRLKDKCVRSDVLSVYIDITKYPDLIRQIDINEEVPPGYAALEVRCYDFNNELRPDLFAKKIEIKAVGVGRGDVIVKATFRSSQPDVYVHQIKFPYAVRLDEPLQYRVISISDETGPVASEWFVQSNWTSMIDITSDIDEPIE